MWQEQACLALCINTIKRIPTLEKRTHPSLRLNTPTQVSNHITEHNFVQKIYQEKLLGISHQLLPIIRFLTDTFLKIINHKLHNHMYVSEQLHPVDRQPEDNCMPDETCSCFKYIYFKKQFQLCQVVIPLDST
jgi:hypothetical protein